MYIYNSIVYERFKMVEQRRKKPRRNISISDNVWNEIDKYITCSKSEWIEKQMIRQITCNNNELIIQRKLEAINNSINDLEIERDNLKDQLQQIREQKELNSKNFKLIEDSMTMIRLINRNEGAIEETRIEYIANQRNIATYILIEKTKEDSSINFIPKK